MRASIGRPVAFVAFHDELSQREVFLVETEEKNYVVKRYDTVARLERDVRASEFARKVAGVRTVSIVRADVQELLVLREYIPGTALGKHLALGDLPDTTLVRVARDLGEQLRRLHLAGVRAAIGLPVLSLWEALDSELARTRAAIKVLEAAKQSATSGKVLLEMADRLEVFIKLHGSESGNSGSTVVHGDLYSANVIVGHRMGINLVDFEWACYGDPRFDLARVYCRGFVARDPARPYRVHPPGKLWQGFVEGYGAEVNPMEPEFRAALLFGLVRTVNHYGSNLVSSSHSVPVRISERTMKRIAAAAVDYLC